MLFGPFGGTPGLILPIFLTVLASFFDNFLIYFTSISVRSRSVFASCSFPILVSFLPVTRPSLKLLAVLAAPDLRTGTSTLLGTVAGQRGSAVFIYIYIYKYKKDK